MTIRRSYAATEPILHTGGLTLTLKACPQVPTAYFTPYVVNTTNFYAFDLTCGMGTQYVYAAIRDVAGNTTYVTNRFYPTCLTNGSYQYNTAGCLTNRQYRGKDYVESLGLTWNGQYQLTVVATNGAVAERYGYDAVGKRIFIVEGGVTNWMIYDDNQVVAEVDNAGNLKKSYIYEALDRVISMTTYGTATNTYYFIRDHLGSTLALTDSGGNIVESYRYDAWGRVLGVYNAAGNQIDESAIGNRILWQGRDFSFKTGLYYFRARYYDPGSGRWISKDPLGISGGLNQYVAFADNPVIFADPLGLTVSGILDFGVTRVDYTDKCGNEKSTSVPDGQGFINILNQLAQQGATISLISIKGHGTEGLQSLGGGWILSADSRGVTLTDPQYGYHDVTGLLNGLIGGGANINLNGCKTGRGSDSVAQDLSRVLPCATVRGGAFYQFNIPFTSKTFGTKNVFQNGNMINKEWYRIK